MHVENRIKAPLCMLLNGYGVHKKFSDFSDNSIDKRKGRE